jgi:glycosyltransferase involved in cell wall biosynthesis
MKLAVVSGEYPPLRSSGAVLMRDFVADLRAQGHEVVCVAPGTASGTTMVDVDAVRTWVPFIKSTHRVPRGLAEIALPLLTCAYILWHRRRFCGFDAVLWYSPTIFLGLVVHLLKRMNGCPAYLILRDIFPEWALDLGVLRPGAAYRFFQRVALYQYRVADVIGVQTPGNLAYFTGTARRVEVLRNWIAPQPDIGCSIDVSQTALRGRKVFVYAGNMGVAQAVDVILDLAAATQDRTDIGFLLVGRGNDAPELRSRAAREKLDNVVFFDEIDPSEIPGLYAQCHVGLVVLDPRHKSHNIPGKFLSYMQAGLPVLARVNANNDLVEIIAQHGVGRSSDADGVPSLLPVLIAMADEAAGPEVAQRCRHLAESMFSPRAVTQQALASLGLGRKPPPPGDHADS